MPTVQESQFFIEAFRVLDQYQGTNWLQSYNNLTRQSDNGRINWKEIPGLFRNGGPRGYTGAIKTISELLTQLYSRHQNDQRFKEKYKNLTKLAKEVYESRRDHQRDFHRRKGLFSYFLFVCPLCTCLQDEETLSHTAVKRIWKQAWLTLNR